MPQTFPRVKLFGKKEKERPWRRQIKRRTRRLKMFQDLVVQNVTDRQKRKRLEKGLVKRETFFFFENYFKLMEFS